MPSGKQFLTEVRADETCGTRNQASSHFFYPLFVDETKTPALEKVAHNGDEEMHIYVVER
jgi:hypothetical protein